MSGRPIASNVRATGPSLTVVLPIIPPPPLPEAGDPAAVVDLHPAAEDVGEAEAIGDAQRLQVLDHVRRRFVVVGHARVEGEPL